MSSSFRSVEDSINWNGWKSGGVWDYTGLLRGRRRRYRRVVHRVIVGDISESRERRRSLEVPTRNDSIGAEREVEKADDDADI
jgi:hypothetical protein